MTDLDALVASPWWRWMPRMRGIDRNGRGFTVLGVHVSGDVLATLGEPGFSSVAMRAEAMRLCVPDATDPATLGCLLALAREAWGDPELFVRREIGGPGWVVIRSRSVRIFRDATEPAALIAAILAAPPPEVSDG